MNPEQSSRPKPDVDKSIPRPIIYLGLVWLLLLPAVLPLFKATLTDSADGLLHLYRLVALRDALQAGVIFPRWLPDLAYGYGFPLFVYYAPLSYYLSLPLTLIGITPGLNLSFALALLVSGSSLYLFANHRFGPLAGIVAAAAYGYAPYLLLNTLSRGSLPASWAMAVFPFVFWLFSLLIDQPDHRRLLIPISGLTLGIALLLHNISSLIFGPILALFLVVELISGYLQMLRINQGNGVQNKNPGVQHYSFELQSILPSYLKQVVWPAAIAGLLGVGLAAFFLLPATLEKEFAQVERVITTPDFDFRYNFVTLSDLLALPQPANTGLLNPHYPFTLGVAQVALALVGLIGSFRLKKASQRATVIFAALGLAGLILMMLPVSLPIWEVSPTLAFIQHPHRLLGPAAFLLAVLCGVAVAVLPQRVNFWLALAGIGLFYLSAVPLLYPRYLNPLPLNPTRLDMMAYEHASGAIGTTSFGEYLPIWVQQTPHESPLEAMYQANAVIERLDPAYLPPGTTIESANYGFNQAEVLLNAPEPLQAVFHTFYFPGWQALVDNQAAPVAPVSERGLIGVSLPEGRHRLQLFFAETPIRRIANGLSILALVAIVGLLVYALRGGLPKNISTDTSEESKTIVLDSGNAAENRLSRAQLGWLVGLAVLPIVLKMAYFDQFDTPFKHTFNGAIVNGVGAIRQVNFGGQVDLLGFDLEQQAVESGQTFNLTPYWRARQPLATDYSSLAQLVDEAGNLYAAQDNLHPGAFRSTRWQPWGFVQDPHTVPVPPGLPPGDYLLVTGLYDPATWARLPVLAGSDNDWPDIIAIPVNVRPPATQPSIEELGIAWPVEAEFGDLRLLGVTPEREIISPNDFLRVALFWESPVAPTQNYQINLRLLAPDGSVIQEITEMPSHNRYPTTKWAAGERVRDDHALWIPPDLPPGAYRLQVRVLDEAGQPIGAWVEVGILPQ